MDQATHTFSKQASICLAFPDGYNKSFDPIMKKLNLALGNQCPVFGGAAGTLWYEESPPLQFFKNEILVDAIPIMIFAGSLEYSFSCAFRKDVLGTRVEQELQILQGSLPKQLPIVEFYSFVNEAFSRKIGYAKGELLGKTPFDFGLDAVYEGLDQHTGGLKSDDDITLVVAKVFNN